MAGCVSYLCWAECRRFLQSLAPPMPRAGFDEIYGVHMYVRIYIVLRVFSYIFTSYYVLTTPGDLYRTSMIWNCVFIPIVKFVASLFII